MEPTEPIDRFNPPPPPQEPRNTNPLTKLFEILVGLKNDLVSYFKSLTNRSTYVKVPESETDQKIQKIWFDKDAHPSKSAVKSNQAHKKQRFQEDLTSMRTYSKNIDIPIRDETRHKRRKSEEQSNVRAIVKLEKEKITPRSKAEKTQYYIKASSHQLSEQAIESIFNSLQNGSFLISKSNEGYIVLLKRNDAIEIHPFKQMEDEDGFPLEEIEYKNQKHKDFESFLSSIDVTSANIILPKKRLETIQSIYTHNLSREDGIKFLSDKPNKSFIILPSDKPEYPSLLLIKKESILPFVKPSYEAVYFRIENGNQKTKGRAFIQVENAQNWIYPDFNSFLEAKGTTIHRGIIPQ